MHTCTSWQFPTREEVHIFNVILDDSKDQISWSSTIYPWVSQLSPNFNIKGMCMRTLPSIGAFHFFSNFFPFCSESLMNYKRSNTLHINEDITKFNKLFFQFLYFQITCLEKKDALILQISLQREELRKYLRWPLLAMEKSSFGVPF